MIIDIEKLKLLYRLGSNIGLKDIQSLVKVAKKRTYQPSEYLIKEGSVSKEVFYIRKGIVRSIAVNDKGDEITTALRWEQHIVASPDVILFKEPSKRYFQAIEPTEVLSLDYDLIQEIIAKNPKLEQSRKLFLQRYLKEAYQRIDTFVLYSPEERYIKFIQDHPTIANRVPDKYIANILGITPVSLSRIRKRIAAKKRN